MHTVTRCLGWPLIYSFVYGWDRGDVLGILCDAIRCLCSPRLICFLSIISLTCWPPNRKGFVFLSLFLCPVSLLVALSTTARVSRSCSNLCTLSIWQSPATYIICFTRAPLHFLCCALVSPSIVFHLLLLLYWLSSIQEVNIIHHHVEITSCGYIKVEAH